MPTPREVWIAALQLDCPIDISGLPLVDRRQKDISMWGGDPTCLPDAAMLCKFIKSKSMLQRIYDSGLPVPVDIFYPSKHPSANYAVHVAMRNCWFDMIDVWDLSEEDQEDFALKGSHWDYFQHLATLQPDIRYQEFTLFDFAARNGELEVLKRLPYSITGTISAMDNASEEGHLDVVMWLHINRDEGCSDYAMNHAARYGHLDIVKWLHYNRTEGCSHYAIDFAAELGHLDVVKWLHENRKEGCSDYAMAYAAKNGHIDVVKFLHKNTYEADIDFALYSARVKGHADIVAYLEGHKSN